MKMRKTVKKPKKSENKISGMPRLFSAVFFLILVFSFAICPYAYAADETTYFGSESYSWGYDETWPIGIYASSSETIFSVILTVTYDPDMIEYVQGAELIEEGVIQISSDNVNSTEFSRLVYMKPVCSGTTIITIESAEITDISGNTVTVDESTSVVVENTIASDALFETLTINGTEISGFDAEILTYNIDIESADSELEIEYAPADMEVEVSDTQLETGENTVYVYVTGTDGSRACYTFVINRTEPETAAETAAPAEEEETEAETETETETAGTFNTTTIAAIIVLLIIILNFILDMMIVRRRKNYSEDEQSDEEIYYSPLDEDDIYYGSAEEEETHYGSPEEGGIFYGLIEDEEISHVLPDEEEISYDLFEFEELDVRKDQAVSENIEIELPYIEFPADESEDEEDLTEDEEITTEDGKNIIIDVSHVTMVFSRDKDEATSFKELIIRIIKRQRQVVYFKALDDISFSVMEGEVIGIIGSNGSGKSTMLKIISGALSPTKGHVKVDKSKVQLLTLGTGFDFELTGRENIYLNGAVIGYSRQFIDEHFDQIVEFAELEGFMDEKVRNYSSGMVSRLAFAIATAGNVSEILILDEVLSVGDLFFRKKSEARIKELIHGGSTVLIVSHSMNVIRTNCSKVIWIEKGHLKMSGDPETVCKAYETMNKE